MSSSALTSARSQTTRCIAATVFGALFALLFQYRILALLKRLGTDVTPIGTKFPLALDFQSAPRWLYPFYYALDYLNTVWFTTLLGLLIAGAVLTFLSDFVQTRLRGDGFREHLGGVLLGIPNMFCTCCAATTLPGLRKSGAGFGATLAFFITAPALNIVVILLAFQLLPLRLAIVRLVLGLVAAIGVTYVLARFYPSVPLAPTTPTVDAQGDKRPASLIWAWLSNSWDGAKAAIPLLIVGIFIISVLKTVVPVEVVIKNLGDGILPTVAASAIGSLLMVPTFTEVLWVGEFAKQGMGIGPAVALLITLPSVSLPSLWVMGRVFKSYRLAALLGIAVFVLGIIGGIVATIW